MSEKRSSKVYYSSQKESGWDIKKTEFEEKIKELKTMKSDLFKQKENLEQLKKQKIPLRKISAEELEISLRIAQEDNESLKKIIGHDREKTRGMEKELEACKTACKELDYKNRVAQLQLTEKDRVLSRYLCEMLILKQEVEKIISPSSTLSTSITNSLNLLYSVENQKKFISIEEKTEEKSIEIPRSSKFYESEIARLQKQLFETQDLYKLTSQQLKEIIEKNNRQDSEFLKVRGKLQDTRNEFSQISSQVIRNSNDRDFQAKALIVELEELRKKRDQQESEIVKIEQRYKSSLSELELDLEKSRRKILELIEAKTKLESEVGGGKSEKKEIYGQLQFKDLKISELSATLQNTTHELNLLKKIVKAKPNECMYDSKGKYEGKWMEVAQENEELRERIEIYESERVRQQAELQNTSKTIVKQLSNIILSRDHQGPVEDMTRNLSRILVENRPIFEVLFT